MVDASNGADLKRPRGYPLSVMDKKEARNKENAPPKRRVDAIQVHFFVRNTGRYIPTRKRKVFWHFVMFPHGSDGRYDLKNREDHEIELSWSVKSGKRELFWNKKNISHLFADENSVRKGRKTTAPSTIQFSWRTSRGNTFDLVARSKPVSGMNQYDFLVDGASYFSLPTWNETRQLREPAPTESPEEEESVPGEEKVNRTIRQRSDIPSPPISGNSGLRSFDRDELVDLQEQKQRLESAGFRTRYEFDMRPMEDELRSDRYSSALDILRGEVVPVVPDTDEMISRAIINAFSQEHDTETSHDSAEASHQSSLDGVDVEVDVVAETLEWYDFSAKYVRVYELEELSMELMQKHVETIVSHVRHDRLDPRTAAKIMLRVASLLQLEVLNEFPRDTIILRGLNSLTSSDDIYDACEAYGNVDGAAVSKAHEGYGLCRFTTSVEAKRFLNESSKQEFRVNGRSPALFELQSFVFANSEATEEEKIRADTETSDSFDEEEEYYCRHMVDPSEDGIEMSLLPPPPPQHQPVYTTSAMPHRGSMPMSLLARPSTSQSSPALESSVSSSYPIPLSPPTFRRSPLNYNVSTGTIGSFPATPMYMEDMESSGADSFTSSAVLD